MFTEINRGIWAAGNDMLFADKTAAWEFKQSTGLDVDLDAVEYPARGVVTGSTLNLTTSSTVRMVVEQLLSGNPEKNHAVCTKPTYTSVCGRAKLH